MHTDIRNQLELSGTLAQYDSYAKALLGNKYILAYIIQETVQEFSDLPIEEIYRMIEGEPLVNMVPLDPGMTNTYGDRITGNNTESSIVNEGTIYFDIIFYVRRRDGISRMAINLEPQREFPTKYHLPNRAAFYMSRSVSSQKERVFTGENYDAMEQTYTIWICMNMKEDSLCWQTVMHKPNFGYGDAAQWTNVSIFNFVFIGIERERPGVKNNPHKTVLSRLLGTIFSTMLTVEERIEILRDEFHIATEKSIFTAFAVSKWLNAPNQENGITVSIASSRCKPRRTDEYHLRCVSYTVTSRELVRQVPNQQPFTAALFRGLAPLRPPLTQKCYRYDLISPLTNGRYTDIM